MSFFYDHVKLAARNNWFVDKVCSIPNVKLDATGKMVVLGISQEYVRRGIPHTQRVLVWYPNIGDQVGLAVDAVKRWVPRLDKARAIVKETLYEKNQQGVKVWHTYLYFTPQFLLDPASLFMDVPSNRGKDHIKKHKGCGGIIVNLCTGCGQVGILGDDIYYEPIDPEPERNTGELARLDAAAAAIEKYGGDVAAIPDEIVDELGSPEAVLNASPVEIARVIDERAELAEEASKYAEGFYGLSDWYN